MSLVSIIMPSYNSGKTISDAIQSVLSQTYSDWELIIIDDFSTDLTLSIINSFCDSRIKVISMESNSGSPVKPRNCGILQAAGDYISFLDSDDIWFPNKLEIQLSEMQSKGYFVSHSSYNRVDVDGLLLKSVYTPTFVDFNKLLHGNCIGNLTGIYNSNVLGKFYQKDIGHEDYLMWLQILSKSPSLGISQPLAAYRVVDSSVSSNKLKAMMWHYNILKHEMNLASFKVCLLMVSYLFKAVVKRFI
ncbi:glycosyltransferase [Shewanella sp. SM34]|uniref:glycosyltransferase family 2 protein n=1 Tax=unclassified Shewanella TaxID=196818 RepID=UPI0021D920C1|nr:MULTISPECIES: glycosyltransferase family 2 protein [unclassified Shewanella]MCU8055572.1 glycosyltransferase [Shewanella sp. SM35]MCU8064494.1 glycosyltransferase [Shewanella sp. SM34]